MKAFAYGEIDVNQNLKLVLRRVENIVRKVEMLVTSIFSISHDVFKRLLFQVIKSQDCVINKELKSKSITVKVSVTVIFIKRP